MKTPVSPDETGVFCIFDAWFCLYDILFSRFSLLNSVQNAYFATANKIV